MHPVPSPPYPPALPLYPANLRPPRWGDANLRLNEDILREIFRRIDNPRSLCISLLSCKSFFRLICNLSRKPFFIGFYHSPNPNSRLPQYIHTEPGFTNPIPKLTLQFLHPSEEVHYKLIESRVGHLLLFKFIHGSSDLHFVVANPFLQSCVSIEPVPPPLFDHRKHRLIVCSYVPLTSQPNGEFKIIVVFSDKEFGTEFTIMAFSSGTGNWTIHRHDENEEVAFPKRGYQEGLEPTIYAENILYKLQSSDYILAVDLSISRLSKIDLPVRGDFVHYGTHIIGKTEDGKLCFFLLYKFLIFIWVYRDNKNTGPEWVQGGIVNLNRCMDPGVMGEVANMRFSSHVGDQAIGCKLATLNGFAEETGVLIMVLRDWVVSFEVKSKKMKVLWYSDDMYNRVQTVYPYEMQWPPVVMKPFEELEGPVENGGVEEEESGDGGEN